MNRKKFLTALGFLAGATVAWPEQLIKPIAQQIGNFKYVYGNQRLKKDFFLFLQNVFHLFPEEELHELIAKASIEKANDQDVYVEVQSQLDEISPCLAALRYQLPALAKQKKEMAKQTVALLGEDTSYKGYLEIGSSGRYLDHLEEKVNIEGTRYYADNQEPGYSLPEMIDRGQIAIGAEFLPMAGYHTDYNKVIPKESLDLVTVYIGFHHCPLELRKPFISGIRDCLRPGGKLILRDHDCHNEDMKRMVGLAHDVFNMGTEESWTYNEQEIRNFYALDFICEFVSNLGFKFDQRSLFQEGDPTKNALMLFTKV